MKVVVVESPSKAKTIEKYLGKDYTVLASYGHVRDLVSKDGSVKPDEDFAMTWQVDDRGKKHIDAIAKALKGALRIRVRLQREHVQTYAHAEHTCITVIT